MKILNPKFWVANLAVFVLVHCGYHVLDLVESDLSDQVLQHKPEQNSQNIITVAVQGVFVEWSFLRHY